MRSIRGRNPEDGEAIEVVVDDGRIRAIRPASSGAEQWLSPGFIDLQINGYGGHDLNSASLTPDIVIALARQLVALGVTSFLPTLITAAEERIVASLRAIAAARRISPLAASMIPFVHVEGPHISPVDGPRGAHPGAHVRPPNRDEFNRWQAAGDALVGLVTLSPHWDGSLDYISHLARSGILVAIGHTDADPAQIRAAAEAGARLSTHLGNGAAAVLPRHPNLLWAQLADDRLTATFIADGHHLPADTLTAMLRAKGLDRSILVSDAVAIGGLPPGLYETPVGGKVELTAAGRVGIPGTAILAGAALPLPGGIARVARLPGFSLHHAVRMATGNPGRFLGGRGVLRVGAPADLVQFSWSPDHDGIRIARVFVNGVEQ